MLPGYGGLAYFFFSVLFLDENIYTSFGIGIVIYSTLDILLKLGKYVVVKELILFIASFQWILGAKISFSLSEKHHKYHMYVDENTYMSYVVPGVFMLLLGFKIYGRKYSLADIRNYFNEKSHEIFNRQKAISYILIFIGISSFGLKLVAPPSLDFILFLTKHLFYVGVAYLFFLYPQKKWLIFGGLILFELGLSIRSGMFHGLILVGVFSINLVVSEKMNVIKKLIGLGLVIISMYFLQTIKEDFRQVIWSKDNVNPIEVFYTMYSKQLTEATTSDVENSDVNNRLNQGWIISKVLSNIPTRKDFLGGTTIFEAFEASLLPRFLFPNKVGSSKGIINFQKITGLKISKGTSMGLSIIAEFYANFGRWGGWMAMLIYGVFITLILELIEKRLGDNSPFIYLWLILFFVQVVKAETDFLKILNHLTKSILFFVLVKEGLKSIGVSLFTVENEHE